eukprot:jgi/Chlat1/393/Chrsp10S01502
MTSRAVLSPSALAIAFAVAANGAGWLDCAALSTCLKNFPRHRGVVVGVLKAMLGLGSAVFTQCYRALFAPDVNSFILFLGLVPLAVVSLLVPFVNLVPEKVRGAREDDDDQDDDEEGEEESGGDDVRRLLLDDEEEGTKHRLRLANTIVLALAVYIFCAILVQEMLPIPEEAYDVILLGLVVMLMLPIFVASGSGDMFVRAALPLSAGTTNSKTLEAGLQSPLLPPSSISSVLITSPGPLQQASTPSSSNASKDKGDYTLLVAVRKANFWMLSYIVLCGAGAGLMVILVAAGGNRPAPLVASFSVANCLGRIVAGNVSEHFVKSRGTPRPAFLAISAIMMSCAHLFLSFGGVAILYPGVVGVGFAFGAHWGLLAPTASELFGLTYFGAISSAVMLSAGVGSILFSSMLAGYIYSLHLPKAVVTLMLLVFPQQHIAASFGATHSLSPNAGGDTEHTCVGPQCFGDTFLIVSAACATSTICAVWLVVRTRRRYHRILAREQQAAGMSS